jgi:DNA polymerase III subunit delta'
MKKLNWNLTGHDKILQLLEKDIEQKTLAHANLFAGPDKIGKYTAAKRLALMLQCEKGGCNDCNVCREINNRLHSDTIEIVNDGERIKIDLIREVIEKVNITKQSSYKILLIQNIERMTEESANSMLKTLEDPPPGVLFLMTASRTHEVLPTIISRVRIYNFSKLAAPAMEDFLKKMFPLADETIIKIVIDFSGGQPGKAISLMENNEKLEAYGRVHNDIEALITNNDKVEQCGYIGNLVAVTKEMKNDSLVYEFLDVLQLILRKKLMNFEEKDDILGKTKILGLLDKIVVVRESMQRNVNTKMLLENLMFYL